MRIKFKSDEVLKEALPSLKETLAKLNSPFFLQVAPPTPSLFGVVLPPAMSVPERIGKGLHLAEKVVRFFDGRAGIAEALTDEVLAAEGAVAWKLDLVVLYLRRVHHFCFYLAQQFKDEWEMTERGGAAVLRARLEDGSKVNADIASTNSFVEKHELSLASRLEAPSLERPLVVIADDAVVLHRVEELIGASTEEVAANKFLCTGCDKLFKSPGYVAKHFRKMHTDLIEKVRQDVNGEMAREAFLNDDDGPIVLRL